MITVDKINDIIFVVTVINQYFPEYERIVQKLLLETVSIHFFS